MAGKIFLFTGQEKYNLNKELKFWTDSFRQKFGESSVDVYNSENRNEWKINQAIFWWWLFAVQKMTVIKWIPLSAERSTWFTAEMVDEFIENFMKKYEQIPNENIVIFVSYNPDKRWRFFKFFASKWLVTKEFTPISEIQRKIFVKDWFKKFNISISENCITTFLEKVGTDLYQIDSEIDKLQEYCKMNSINEITNELIEKVTFGITENNAFAVLNTAFIDKTSSIKKLQKIQDEWTNRNEFAWALYSQLKSSIMINRLYKLWIKDSKEIATKCWLNPNAVFINMKNIKDIAKNWIEIENTYKCLLETDYKIKSGKCDEIEFWLNIKKMIIKFKN